MLLWSCPESDARHLSDLRAYRVRPGRDRAAEKSEELAPFHLVTSTSHHVRVGAYAPTKQDIRQRATRTPPIAIRIQIPRLTGILPCAVVQRLPQFTQLKQGLKSALPLLQHENVTGVTQLSSELIAKRLGLLHDLIPTAPCVCPLGCSGIVLPDRFLRRTPSVSRLSSPENPERCHSQSAWGFALC